MKLSPLIPEGAIVARLAAKDRDAVIRELVAAVIASGAAPAELRDELVTRVLERELRGSTGFGKGIAVPHVKHKQVQRIAAAIGLAPNGIDFAALDKQPVYTVFLLVSPSDQPEDHLSAMEAIFRHVQKDTFRRFLRQATTNDDVRTLLDEADGQHIGA
jgi:mannitol/fructose-specific phosphotransferase system IIA component (Ntr-type)